MGTDALGFWDDPPEVTEAVAAIAQAPVPVGSGDPSTSFEAALAAAGRAGSVRATVLGYLAGRGILGATNSEIEADLHLARPTGSNRRGDLERAGLCRATSRRRPTPTGSPAIVYEITSLGQRVAEHLAAQDAAQDQRGTP